MGSALQVARSVFIEPTITNDEKIIYFHAGAGHGISYRCQRRDTTW